MSIFLPANRLRVKRDCCSAEFPINATSMEGQQKTQMYHYFIEAAKFANGQRRSISDPRFSTKKVWLFCIDMSVE